GFRCHGGTALRGREEKLDHAAWLGAGGHSQGDVDAARTVAARPVDDFGGDEVAVRNDHVRSLAGPYSARAHADAPHLAAELAKLDDVAHLYRLLVQRMRPETKLLTTFCKPNPMPSPSVPARTVKRVISTPAASTAEPNPTPITAGYPAAAPVLSDPGSAKGLVQGPISRT